MCPYATLNAHAATTIRELKHFESFACPPNIAQMVGAGDPDNTPHLLRQPKLHKKEYRTLRRRITAYVADNSRIASIRWEIGRGLIARYGLVEITPHSRLDLHRNRPCGIIIRSESRRHRRSIETWRRGNLRCLLPQGGSL